MADLQPRPSSSFGDGSTYPLHARVIISNNKKVVIKNSGNSKYALQQRVPDTTGLSVVMTILRHPLRCFTQLQHDVQEIRRILTSWDEAGPSYPMHLSSRPLRHTNRDGVSDQRTKGKHRGEHGRTDGGNDSKIGPVSHRISPSYLLRRPGRSSLRTGSRCGDECGSSFQGERSTGTAIRENSSERDERRGEASVHATSGKSKQLDSKEDADKDHTHYPDSASSEKTSCHSTRSVPTIPRCRQDCPIGQDVPPVMSPKDETQAQTLINDLRASEQYQEQVRRYAQSSDGSLGGLGPTEQSDWGPTGAKGKQRCICALSGIPQDECNLDVMSGDGVRDT
jgi:hypothetical protein